MNLGTKIAIFVVVVVLIAVAVYFIFIRDTDDDTIPVVGPSPGPAPEPPKEPGPCDEYTDNTKASSVSVACLRKILTDLGCSTTASLYNSIDDSYSGWLLTDGEGGTGTYRGIRSAVEDYVNSDDDVKRDACFGKTTP